MPLNFIASPRIYQHGSHWKEFREILYWKFFWKSVGKSNIRLIWNKNIGHFTQIPKCCLVVDSSTKYFVSQRQTQGRNPFFLPHGTSHGFVLLNSTCKITTLQMERIVTYPLQKWLCEGATVLLYTFFVFFMVYITTLSVVRIE